MIVRTLFPMWLLTLATFAAPVCFLLAWLFIDTLYGDVTANLSYAPVQGAVIVVVCGPKVVFVVANRLEGR
jgi:hypothetical protein